LEEVFHNSMFILLVRFGYKRGLSVVVFSAIQLLLSFFDILTKMHITN